MKRWQAASCAALGVLAGFLYLALPSFNFPGDGVAYAGALRSALSGEQGSPSLLFHPHHILYNPLCLAALRWTGADTSDSYGILRVMAAVSAVCGGLAVAALGLAVLRATGSLTAALCCAATLAASRGMFTFARGAEVLALSAALSAVAILVAATGPPGIRRTALSGLAAGAAALGHVTNVLLWPALAWGALAGAGAPAGGRRRGAPVLWLGSALGVVAAAYGLGAAGGGFLSAGAARDWLAPRASLARFLSVSPANLAADAGALLGVLSAPAARPPVPWLPEELDWSRAMLEHSADHVPAHVALARASLLAWLAVLPAWLAWRRRRAPAPVAAPAADSTRRLARVCAGGLIPVTAFFTFWDAGNIEFWLVPLVLLLGLAGCVLAAALGGGPRSPLAWVASLVGTTLPCALLIANMPAVVFPGLLPDQNEDLAFCRLVSMATDRGDAVLLSGLGQRRALAFYLPYFEGNQVLTAHRALLDPGGAAEGIRHLGESMRAAAGARAGPWLLSEWDDPATSRELAERAGPDAARLEELLAGFDRVRAIRDDAGRTAWLLAPRAAAALPRP